MSEPDDPDKDHPEPTGETPAEPTTRAGGEGAGGEGAGGADEELGEGAFDEEADSEIRDMLRGALQREEEEAPPPDVLRGVQRRLRERSGGKFYADGWSTERHPPISMFLLTSLLMLAIVFIVYAVLNPTAGKPVHVKMAPAPVHVLPPQHR